MEAKDKIKQHLKQIQQVPMNNLNMSLRILNGRFSKRLISNSDW